MRFGAFVVDPKLLCLNALLHYTTNLISFSHFYNASYSIANMVESFQSRFALEILTTRLANFSQSIKHKPFWICIHPLSSQYRYESIDLLLHGLDWSATING